MVRLGNFKKLEVIGNEGDIATWGDKEEIASVFLSIDGDVVRILINPDESEFKEEIIE